jgi:signal transduction histidine kinase
VKWLHSFRTVVILGSVLWTLGLLGIAHMVSLAVIPHVPALLYADHHVVIVLGVLFMLVGFATVRTGLSSLRELRRRLASVRAGHARRVEGEYPSEIQPVVDDLNTLLENRERAVTRALTTAGDLAHGLKTPLALLAQEAERAQSAGYHELASAIDQHIDRMRRQVDYHLAHARAVASGKTSGIYCKASDAVDGLVRTLTKLHADRGLIIRLDVAPDHMVCGQREDLDEMLGNLLDNAYKWARTTVTVRSFETRDHVIIVVEDDGPGLNSTDRENVLQRGVRADETAPGSGLGLAIVRDLAELYGGTIALCESSLGGLQARLEFPKP